MRLRERGEREKEKDWQSLKVCVFVSETERDSAKERDIVRDRERDIERGISPKMSNPSMSNPIMSKEMWKFPKCLML